MKQASIISFIATIHGAASSNYLTHSGKIRRLFTLAAREDNETTF
jgi:hypothetical protein